MTKSNISNGPWIIGGAGRSGKTTLVNLIDRSESPIAGMPLEMLLSIYDKRLFLNFSSKKLRILVEYLSRPRYVDINRDESVQPISLFKNSLQELKAAIPDEIKNVIQLIDWILQRFAEDRGCDTWAAFDLYPEFRYEIFLRFIPGLKLGIMIRDPRESLCEIMYWRHYPGRSPDGERRFKHALIMGALSADVVHRLKSKYPDKVYIFFFNGLINREVNMMKYFSDIIEIDEKSVDEVISYKPYYSFKSGDKFLTPDNDYKKLLSPSELKMIEVICKPLLNNIGCVDINSKTNASSSCSYIYILIVKLVLLFGRVSPVLAQNLAGFIYYPLRQVKRSIGNIKLILKDNLNFEA